MDKEKKIIYFLRYLLLICLTISLFSCNKLKIDKLISGYSPEETINEWINSVKSNNYKLAFKCLSEESQKLFLDNKGNISDLFKTFVEELSPLYNSSEIVIENKEVVEENIWLYLKLTKDSESKIYKFVMVREGNFFGKKNWRILWN